MAGGGGVKKYIVSAFVDHQGRSISVVQLSSISIVNMRSIAPTDSTSESSISREESSAKTSNTEEHRSHNHTDEEALRSRIIDKYLISAIQLFNLLV